MQNSHTAEQNLSNWFADTGALDCSGTQPSPTSTRGLDGWTISRVEIRDLTGVLETVWDRSWKSRCAIH